MLLKGEVGDPVEASALERVRPFAARVSFGDGGRNRPAASGLSPATTLPRTGARGEMDDCTRRRVGGGGETSLNSDGAVPPGGLEGRGMPRDAPPEMGDTAAAAEADEVAAADAAAAPAKEPAAHMDERALSWPGVDARDTGFIGAGRASRSAAANAAESGLRGRDRPLMDDTAAAAPAADKGELTAGEEADPVAPVADESRVASRLVREPRARAAAPGEAGLITRECNLAAAMRAAALDAGDAAVALALAPAAAVLGDGPTVCLDVCSADG